MLRRLLALAGVTGAIVGMMLGLAEGIAPLAGAAPPATPTPFDLPDPVLGPLDLDAVTAIDLASWPLVPEISENARALYAHSLARGGDPHAFIKVGDCMTDTPHFLIPIGAGDYALGDYAHLERVIAQFRTEERDSFARQSQAAAGGFNVASILDAIWANPEFCQAGETPLSCELRIMQPSIALIMFGTNDVQYLTAEQFSYFLRALVVETIRAGVLPVLSTFPHRPEFPEQTILFNQIVAGVARDYEVPLINLWLALEPLPDRGVDLADPTHMTVPASGAVCAFVDENLAAGFTMRNLLTLQTLEAVLVTVEAERN
jgi:hypothetical protein